MACDLTERMFAGFRLATMTTLAPCISGSEMCLTRPLTTCMQMMQSSYEI